MARLLLFFYLFARLIKAFLSSFLHFKSSHIPHYTLFQIHDLFFITSLFVLIFVWVYINNYKNLWQSYNVTCKYVFCDNPLFMCNQLMYSSLGRSTSLSPTVTWFSVIFCRELKSHGLSPIQFCVFFLPFLFRLHLVNNASETLYLYLLILLGERKSSHSKTFFSYGSYNFFTLFFSKCSMNLECLSVV